MGKAKWPVQPNPMRRDQVIVARVSKEEKETLERLARSQQISISDLLRGLVR